MISWDPLSERSGKVMTWRQERLQVNLEVTTSPNERSHRKLKRPFRPGGILFVPPNNNSPINSGTNSIPRFGQTSRSKEFLGDAPGKEHWREPPSDVDLNLVLAQDSPRGSWTPLHLPVQTLPRCRCDLAARRLQSRGERRLRSVATRQETDAFVYRKSLRSRP